MALNWSIGDFFFLQNVRLFPPCNILDFRRISLRRLMGPLFLEERITADYRSKHTESAAWCNKKHSVSFLALLGISYNL